MKHILSVVALSAVVVMAAPTLAQTSSGSGTAAKPAGTPAGSSATSPSTTSSPAGTSAASTPSSSGMAMPDAIIRVDVVQLARGMRMSKIIGKDVENEAGEDIGDINDLIINPSDKVTYAVIGVGGFLGMGERLVAVPFDSLKPKANSDDLVLTGATKDRVRQMPEFKYGS